MTDYLVTDTELTNVANAIRTKGGISVTLEFPTEFISAINNIPSGTDVSDTTATAADVLSGKYFYLANGTRTEGTYSGGGGGEMSLTVVTNQTPITYEDAHGAIHYSMTITDLTSEPKIVYIRKTSVWNLQSNRKKYVNIFGYYTSGSWSFRGGYGQQSGTTRSAGEGAISNTDITYSSGTMVFDTTDNNVLDTTFVYDLYIFS